MVVKGRDVFDFPLEIGPGEEISDAVVTFTDVDAGRLRRAAGSRPAVPRRTTPSSSSPPIAGLWYRRWRGASGRAPGTDGRFTVANLPAGEYRIAALTDIAPGEANDPAFLEQLVAASVAFTLGEGEKKVQDLRIAK